MLTVYLSNCFCENFLRISTCQRRQVPLGERSSWRIDAHGTNLHIDDPPVRSYFYGSPARAGESSRLFVQVAFSCQMKPTVRFVS